MQLAMVIGLTRCHSRITVKGQRLYSKGPLDDVNNLLSDAFSSAPGSSPSPISPSINPEDRIDVASIMPVCQDTYLDNCCRIKDVFYAHHAFLCGNMDAPPSFLSEKLFSLYLRLGSIEEAVYLSGSVKLDIWSWNTLMSSCRKYHNAKSAFQLFQKMKLEDVLPDCVTFVILLKACSSLEEGKLLHAQAIEFVSDLNVFAESTLVDIYGKWGSVADAYHVFDHMQERTLVTWSVMIAGFVEAGQNDEAFETYHEMQGAKFRPNEVTFINILRACTCAEALDNVRKIHWNIFEDGFEAYLVVANALIDTYARCGNLEDAHHVFTGMHSRNVVSWTSLIQGYAQIGLVEDTFELFSQMEKQGVTPNSVTISAILKLCANHKLLSSGEQIHNYILMEHTEGIVFVENCLLDMYIKCGQMKAAQQVFDKMSRRDVVSCSTMINALAQYEQPNKAFRVFQQMIHAGMEPNEVTYLGLLQACSSSGCMEKGKRIHDYIIRGHLETRLVIGNALIDMYSKGGSVDAAHVIFDKMLKKDIVSWNSLLAGYCQHGHSTEVFGLFKKMTQEPIKPDRFTFLSLLSTCSYVGLVAEGRRYFDAMTEEHKIKPKAEHCACMVDLLGRAGCVHEALTMINKSTVDSIMVWNALLGACKISGDVDVAEIATKNILKLDPQNTAACVQLSNIYAAAAGKCHKELGGIREKDSQLFS